MNLTSARELSSPLAEAGSARRSLFCAGRAPTRRRAHGESGFPREANAPQARRVPRIRACRFTSPANAAVPYAERLHWFKALAQSL